jgi:hypothetical protein
MSSLHTTDAADLPIDGALRFHVEARFDAPDERTPAAC